MASGAAGEGVRVLRSFELPPAFFLNKLGDGAPGLTLHSCCAHGQRLAYAAVSSFVISAADSLVCAPDVPGGRSLGAHLQTARRGGVIIGHPFNKARDAPTKKTVDLAKALSSLGSTWTACVPQLSSGQTQHTKFLLLCYERFVRVVVMSANLCGFDWDSNTNSIFVQDFPRKEAPAAPAAAFETVLLRYVAALQSKGCNLTALVRHLTSYDFASAKVTLLASVPGAHDASDGYGHLALRAALREAAADAAPAAPAAAGALVAQCSSIGSLSKFVPDFVASCVGAAARTSGRKHALDGGAAAAAPPPLRILWPEADDVRTSTRGWGGGADFPTGESTLKEARDRNLLHVFERPAALQAARAGSLVHGKFLMLCRASSDDGDDASRLRLPGGTEIDFLVTGSHNVSPAAWGGAVAGTGNSTSSNYELSVLLTPSGFANGTLLEAQAVAAGRLPPSRFTVSVLATARSAGVVTSMPPVRFYSQFESEATLAHAHSERRVVTAATADLLVPLPIPFRLPFANGPLDALHEYTAADVPYCADGGKLPKEGSKSPLDAAGALAAAAFAVLDHKGKTNAEANSGYYSAKPRHTTKKDG